MLLDRSEVVEILPKFESCEELHDPPKPAGGVGVSGLPGGKKKKEGKKRRRL